MRGSTLRTDAPGWVIAIKSGDWTNILDTRSQKETEFAAIYAKQFGHGTTGHSQLILINLLVSFINFLFDYYDITPKKEN